METTLQNNKLIAEFMDIKFKIFKGVEYCEPFGYGLNCEEANVSDDLKFDKDWNWLMEVVDKIETLGYSYSTYLSGNVRTVNFRGIIDYNSIDGTILDTTYEAVIEFINWYNINKTI